MTREELRDKYDKTCKYNIDKIDGGYPGDPQSMKYIEWLEDNLFEAYELILEELALLENAKKYINLLR